MELGKRLRPHVNNQGLVTCEHLARTVKNQNDLSGCLYCNGQHWQKLVRWVVETQGPLGELKVSDLDEVGGKNQMVWPN